MNFSLTLQIRLLVALIIVCPTLSNAEEIYTPMSYFPAEKLAETFINHSGVGFSFKKNKLRDGDISLQGKDRNKRLIVTFLLNSDEKLKTASFAASVKGFGKLDATFMTTFLGGFFNKWDSDSWLKDAVVKVMIDKDKKIVAIQEGKAVKLSFVKFFNLLDLKVESKESYYEVE